MTSPAKIPAALKSTRRVVSFAKRHGIRLDKTSREYTAHSGAGLEAVSVPLGSDVARPHESEISRPVQAEALDLPVADPMRPSVDLRKRPRGLLRRIRNLPGKLRHYWQLLRPPLTEEEIEAREEARRIAGLDQLCAKEAKKYAGMVREKLWQLGERELVRQVASLGGQALKVKRKYVLIDAYARDEDFNVIFLRLNTDPKYLPAYVEGTKLVRDQVYADELLPTLKHPVRWDSDEAGVFLTIYRHNLDALPTMVPAEEFWKRFDVNGLPPLAFPVGVGDNSLRKWIDLDECENLIVAGGTGWGKSVMMNNILGFLLWRGVRAADVKLVLFDLKHGLEFGHYDGLPHLYTDEGIGGIVYTIDDVMPALDRLLKIRDERLAILKRHKCRNIHEYNKGRRADLRLPYLLIAIDEWAAIRLTKTLSGGAKLTVSLLRGIAERYASLILDGNDDGKTTVQLLLDFAKEVLAYRKTAKFGDEAENKLVALSSQGRACGMHIILATQNPTKEVLTGLITVNFHSRIVFNTGNVGGSMAALGTQSAYGLRVKGRCILRYGGDEIELQAPFVSRSLTQDIVHYAITGKHLGSSAVDLEEILQYALEHFSGELDLDKLFATFQEKGVRRAWLREQLKTHELTKVVLSSQTYMITKRGNGKPRRLVLSNE